MGSATAQALTASSSALTAAQGITLDVAGELFSATRLIGESSALSGALATVKRREGFVAGAGIGWRRAHCHALLPFVRGAPP